MQDIEALFGKHNDEFLKFERVEVKRVGRADLNAFILLNRLVPGKVDIIDGAEHDEIYLSITPDELMEVATEAQIIDLIRCGVRYDSESDSLAMFV